MNPTAAAGACGPNAAGRVVVYTRAGCGLCRDAERVVGELAAARGVEVALVDVDADEALTREFGARVPVVAIDGVEVAELVVDPGLVGEAVDEALARA